MYLRQLSPAFTGELAEYVMENPPYSHGDIVRNMDDLPAFFAKHVVLEAVKLFPEKSRESAARIIETAIAKFKKAR